MPFWVKMTQISFKKGALTTFLLAMVFFKLCYRKKKESIMYGNECTLYNWCILASFPSKMFFTLRLSSLLNLYSCCKWTQVSILSVFTAMNLNLMPHYKYSAKDIFYILKTLWQIKSTLEVKAAKTATWSSVPERSWCWYFCSLDFWVL